MTTIAIYTILSVLAVSLVSFVGVLSLSLYSRMGKATLFFFVSFAAGALLGDVFIHLLPELAEEGALTFSTSMIILGSIIGFFILEKFIHIHHSHGDTEGAHHHHPVAYLNIIGDGFHNLLDGIIIAAAYLVDIQLGVATTIAVLLHEIPQEVGDFSVLIHAGFSRTRALFYNFLSALMAVVGAIIALTVSHVEDFAPIVIAIGIGSFIYIAVADLIPEIHKSKHNPWLQFAAMTLGIAIMFALLFLE
jgi:zinc and cadmium transporter